MNSSILKAARERLVDITPMAWNCGAKCGAACCQPDEDGQGGVYLFPGEEALCGGRWAEVISSTMGDRETDMLICDGQCDRDRRPLGCMIFPLTPQISEDGDVDVRFDCRARAMCPLLRDGLRGLREEFVEGARAALRIVAQDEEGLRFLRDWQALEEQYDFHL